MSYPPLPVGPVLSPTSCAVLLFALCQFWSWSHPTARQKLSQLKNCRVFCHVSWMGKEGKARVCFGNHKLLESARLLPKLHPNYLRPLLFPKRQMFLAFGQRHTCILLASVYRWNAVWQTLFKINYPLNLAKEGFCSQAWDTFLRSCGQACAITIPMTVLNREHQCC